MFSGPQAWWLQRPDRVAGYGYQEPTALAAVVRKSDVHMHRIPSTVVCTVKEFSHLFVTASSWANAERVGDVKGTLFSCNPS